MGRNARRAIGAVTVGCILLAVLLVLATRHGPAVTPDAVQYISAAQHVSEGTGLCSSVTDFNERRVELPLAAWAPMYPSLLGAVMRFGGSPLVVGRWTNVALAVLTLIPLAAVARAAGGDRSVAPVLVIHSLLFYPILISTFLWSEPLFILCSLASLALIVRGLRRESGFPVELVTAGLFAAAAVLSRYLGVLLILVSIVGIWSRGLRRSPNRLLGDVIAYGLPAALPVFAWLLRNRLVTGAFFGTGRPDPWCGFGQAILDTSRTLLLDAIAPVLRAGGVPAVIGAVAGTLGAILLIVLSVRSERALAPDEASGDGAFRGLLIAYAIVFIGTLVLLVRLVGFDAINTRLLAPVYPVLLVLVIHAFRRGSTAGISTVRANMVRNLHGTAVGLLLLPQLLATGTFISEIDRETRTLSAPYWTSTLWNDGAWQEDPAMKRLPELAGASPLVITNLREVVALVTGLPAKSLPDAVGDAYLERVLEFPGAVIALNDSLRSWWATRDQMHDVAAATGRVAPLGESGHWSFFRVLNAPVEEGDDTIHADL